ncbi:helix-turn-helix domain-containing protein [Paenibacillus xylaniclasticus]|uniref:helix-turn-helix domain-containing protein n=1 Tax=Paenibacillus xylaniclasticus TaxID=588083 RepID=UPI000FD9D5EC|nr:MULTISPECIES: AraC family transcriptional regulator [Paenibacillus]GFN30057.1 hypothetical protein PCURB6_03170 [Paenibacillus curdlanolyticus]
MRKRILKKHIIIFPGELEKNTMYKNDYIYLETNGALEIHQKKMSLQLVPKSKVLVRCTPGSLVIKNQEPNRPTTLHYLIFNSTKKLYQRFIILSHTNYSLSPLLLDDLSFSSYEHWVEEYIDVLNDSDSISSIEDNYNDGKLDPRLIKVYRYIRNNFHHQITLQILAEIADVHPTYLSNTFSKVFNISPIHFLNKLRVDSAKEILRQSDIPITEVAKKVGYLNSPQFSSIFKRYESQSPTDYRKKHRQLVNLS